MQSYRKNQFYGKNESVFFIVCEKFMAFCHCLNEKAASHI